MRNVLMITLVLAGGALAAEEEPKQVVFGSLGGRVLSTGSRRVRIMDEAGKVLWSHPGRNVHDCWMLKTGNVLFADGEVKEVDPRTGKVVWQYKPTVTKGGGAYTCQRLATGVTLVGENSTGRVLEVDKGGKIIFQMQVKPYKAGNHHNMRMARKLKNGNYLVCHSGEHVVREHTPAGKVVFEVKVDAVAFSAVRLANGNTLVGHIGRITEFDPKGKAVWRFAATDIPGVTIRAMCGLHVLPNGNIAVGVYGAYKDGKGNGLFEITRKKKLVWRYADPVADRTTMSIQVLDNKGKPLPGETLR